MGACGKESCAMSWQDRLAFVCVYALLVAVPWLALIGAILLMAL
jgi:hypothetical protein